jgi:hypothetical protein
MQPLTDWTMASRIRGEKLNMLTNPLNMYHRPNRIHKGEVNDPERTRGRKYQPSFSNTSDS